MAEVTRRGLARNLLFGILAEGWRIGSRFILTPIILANIGIEGYGVWTLLFSITAQVALLNTSFGAAYAKLTAELDAQERYAQIGAELGSGMLIMGVLSLLGGSIVFWLRDTLLLAMGVPLDMLEAASSALIIVVGIFLLRFVFGAMRRVLEGLQRLDLVLKTDIVTSFIEFSVALVLILRGWGLLGL